MRSKLGSMSGFTGEEIKIFAVVYSRWALKGLIPDDHFIMWEFWVEAITILGRPVISDADLVKAQSFLKKFTDAFDKLAIFRPKAWVPNMHLVFHLVQDIKHLDPCMCFLVVWTGEIEWVAWVCTQ